MGILTRARQAGQAIVSGSVVDRAVSVLDPERAFRRRAYRNALDVQAGAYRGARSNRTTHAWSAGTYDADSTLSGGDLQTLRNRSRDLNRNEAIAAGVTDAMVNNTIYTGIKPQSQIDYEAIGITEQQAQTFQRQAERAYRRWSSGKWATADMSANADQLQALVMRQVFESGEFLGVRRAIRRRQSPYLLAVQAVEPDRLSTPSDAPPNTSMGITKDANGAPTAYHLRETHPGASTYPRLFAGEYKTVSAYDRQGRQRVFHVYKRMRPGQSRGVPLFAPVMEQFRILSQYIEATLVAARVAACFGAVVKTDYAYGAAVGRSDDTNTDGQRLEGFEPGMIEYLAPGQDITQIRPEQPTEAFAPFTESVFRLMGAGLGLPYEIILRDFSKTNYSSARSALLQAYRIFTEWQQLVIDDYCQPLWELLLEEAWARGELSAPGFEQSFHEYTRAQWIPPGWAWVDPLKEAQAYQLMESIGATSKAEVCAAQGKDWEAVAEQQAREKQRYEDLGLSYEQAPLDENKNTSGGVDDTAPTE